MTTMMTAARDVARISYDDVGRGEPALLFLHGWGANRTVWQQVMERASRHRRAIAIDWPGLYVVGPLPLAMRAFTRPCAIVCEATAESAAN